MNLGFEAPLRMTADKLRSNMDAAEYEYKCRAAKVSRVPRGARSSHFQARAKQLTIGRLVGEVMVAIERDKKFLKGVLPKEYAWPNLDLARVKHFIHNLVPTGGGKSQLSQDVVK